MDFSKIWNSWSDAESFSGVFSVSSEQGIIYEKCCGYRNRSGDFGIDFFTAYLPNIMW